MTTWAELRTVALVGTERRPLPTATDGSPLAGLAPDPSTEHAALRAAALLGTARRAAAPIATTTASPAPPTTQDPSPVPDETPAPPAAIQLLELMLTGNTGPGTMSDSLLEQWYTTCTNRQAVVAHRLLVMVLDGATTTSQLQTFVRPVLGQRGRWLAAHQEKWAWAASPEVVTEAHVQDLDIDELLQLPSERRDAALVAARTADATTGRRLIADACTKLDAASRARVLACLRGELNAEDEDLLEAALDDRSKAVRQVAIELLNGLPSSARAERLSRHLEPLVVKSGRLRSSINITYPGQPEGEQLRDLPPNGNGVIEQQWFDAIITGTPLEWWEATLGMTPGKIVRAKSNFGDELMGAWTAAAVAQHNQAWLSALFERSKNPALSGFIGSDGAADAFLSRIKDKTATTKVDTSKNARLLQAVAAPWTLDFSNDVLHWARTANGGKGSDGRVSRIQVVLADRLHPDTQPALTDWLNSVRGEQDTALQRMLRNIIQQISFRTSIDKAFS